MNVSMALLRAAGKGARSLVGGSPMLRYAERNHLERSARSTIPPIFIMGAPRSGSTLLYQLLAYSCRTSYFTNVASVLYGAPALTTRMIVGRRRYEDATFSSDYGLSRGSFAPSEAGRIFQRWFGATQPMDFSESIRRTVGSIEATMGGPFLWKNLNLTFHLPVLHELFPSALFVHMYRDPAFTCQSIILGLRRRGIGNVPGVMDKRMTGPDVVEQVARGVIDVERRIDGFMQVSRAACCTVRYEDVCSHPMGALAGVVEMYNRAGRLEQVNSIEQHGFAGGDRVRLSTSEWSHLGSAIASAGENAA